MHGIRKKTVAVARSLARPLGGEGRQKKKSRAIGKRALAAQQVAPSSVMDKWRMRSNEQASGRVGGRSRYIRLQSNRLMSVSQSVPSSAGVETRKKERKKEDTPGANFCSIPPPTPPRSPKGERETLSCCCCCCCRALNFIRRSVGHRLRYEYVMVCGLTVGRSD